MLPYLLGRQYDVSAVLGLGNSEIALMTANLLSLFHIPNLGIWATSDELSDKNIYGYFVRLLPPDRFQVGDVHVGLHDSKNTGGCSESILFYNII